jgi:Fe-S-cluster containining protein
MNMRKVLNREMAKSQNKIHPCQSCGACCAAFRVTFHWSETLQESYAVPARLTETVSLHHLSMKGTSTTPVHCEALKGKVGDSVSCSIYANRPSPCRGFEASYENGIRNERCDQVREQKGLKPLSRDDW